MDGKTPGFMKSRVQRAEVLLKKMGDMGVFIHTLEKADGMDIEIHDDTKRTLSSRLSKPEICTLFKDDVMRICRAKMDEWQKEYDEL